MKKALISLMLLFGMTAGMAQDASIPMSNDGFYLVETLQQFQDAVNNKVDAKKELSRSKIRLTADLYLSDLSERTFIKSFRGEIDGNGHTIWAARPEIQHDGRGHYKRCYLFTRTDTAYIHDLTFRNIRVENFQDDRPDQAIVVSRAYNSVFRNLVFDNVSVYGHKGEIGCITAFAYECKIENIEVLYSDFTTNSFMVGGIAGGANNTNFKNCFVDDRTCVCADGLLSRAGAGGIVGMIFNGSTFEDCINCAFVAGDDNHIGGIAGEVERDSKFIRCVNAGMVISLPRSKVTEMYHEYMDGMYYELRNYYGRTFKVRSISSSQMSMVGADRRIGGIVGMTDCTEIIGCVNFGSIYAKGSTVFSSQIGGIVGYLDNDRSKNSIISDCLSWFHTTEGYEDDIFAIAGECSNIGGVTIKNCVSFNDRRFTKEDISRFNSATRNNYTLLRYQDSERLKSVRDFELTSGSITKALGWNQNLGYDYIPVPVVGAYSSLHHTRTITPSQGADGYYGTICLPYSLRSDKSISYYKFDKATTENGRLELHFEFTETVAAGKPAMFRTERTGDVTFPDAQNGYAWRLRGINPSGKWEMDGTYYGESYDGNAAKYIYYVEDNYFTSFESIVIPPFRGYLHGPNADTLEDAVEATPEKEVLYKLREASGEITAITPAELGSLSAESAGGESSFTLMGTKAPAGYRGIVIRGGKKYVRN